MAFGISFELSRSAYTFEAIASEKVKLMDGGRHINTLNVQAPLSANWLQAPDLTATRIPNGVRAGCAVKQGWPSSLVGEVR